MRDEDLERIERGDPSSPVEALLSVLLFLGTVGLLAFIIFGVIW